MFEQVLSDNVLVGLQGLAVVVQQSVGYYLQQKQLVLMSP